MNDIEAFLIFLVYILPFGGIANILFGITENEKSKIILGVVCLLTALFIMGYLIYKAKTEKKTKLLVDMYRHILVGAVLMLAEFLILHYFDFSIHHIILIICISLVIMTIIFSLLQKP